MSVTIACNSNCQSRSPILDLFGFPSYSWLDIRCCIVGYPVDPPLVFGRAFSCRSLPEPGAPWSSHGETLRSGRMSNVEVSIDNKTHGQIPRSLSARIPRMCSATDDRRFSIPGIYSHIADARTKPKDDAT